ncbi:hypothetical protein BD410DRAFT_284153 [Rickenella mellea]|uniref:Uncharacterized protein n=1 Tax=Rickenella mellea TaxID=50990 RepID=A0A4Y7Q2M5_9AGAM|nr:hypothetical protein BD410DRAFT_284153 [Rickenella mellea]
MEMSVVSSKSLPRSTIPPNPPDILLSVPLIPQSRIPGNRVWVRERNAWNEQSPRIYIKMEMRDLPYLHLHTSISPYFKLDLLAKPDIGSRLSSCDHRAHFDPPRQISLPQATLYFSRECSLLLASTVTATRNYGVMQSHISFSEQKTRPFMSDLRLALI